MAAATPNQDTAKERQPVDPVVAKRGEVRDRVPFNSFTKKLEVRGEVPGYHLYWFNDDGERVARALQGGYAFVTRGEIQLADAVVAANSAVDDKVRRLVGKLPNGEPMYAYLMKIPEELWRQDQQMLQDHNDAITRAIRGGRVGNKEQAHSYTEGTPMTGQGVSYNPLKPSSEGVPTPPKSRLDP